jgi:hypothetical protein
MHALIVRRGRILLEKSRHRWRGMWILPPVKPDGLEPSSFQARPIYQSLFPFTHHRITLAIYCLPAPKRIAPGQQWFESIDDVAMPSPHRRVLNTLLHADVSVPDEQRESPGNGRLPAQNLQLATTDQHVRDPKDHRRDNFLLQANHERP